MSDFIENKPLPDNEPSPEKSKRIVFEQYSEDHGGYNTYEMKEGNEVVGYVVLKTVDSSHVKFLHTLKSALSQKDVIEAFRKQYKIDVVNS